MTPAVTVPRLLAAGLVICALLLAIVYIARQINPSTTARCTPQGGCVDRIDRPHVVVRVVP